MSVVLIVTRNFLVGGVLLCTSLAEFLWALYHWLTGRQLDLEATGRRLARRLEFLGGVYPKLGQIAAMRTDLFPAVLLAPLARLHNSMPSFPARQALETAYGARIENIFAWFDAVPLGSGCIAQVHAARLHDSDVQVAVKIRRPGIGWRVKADARMFCFVARLLPLLPGMRGIPVADAARDIAQTLIRQADFLAEARQHQEFQQTFGDCLYVRIPRLRPEYSSAEVLVLELIPDAQSITSPLLTEETYRRLVTQGLRALYRMLFRTGLVHCDLHPGNLLVDKDGSLYVVDFGLVARLGDADLRAFASFFLSIVIGDAGSAARILLETASRVPAEFDRSSFSTEVSALIESASGRRAGEFLVASFVHALFDVQRRHGISGSPRFTMAIIALAVFEGLIRTRAADLDFQREALPYLIGTAT